MVARACSQAIVDTAVRSILGTVAAAPVTWAFTLNSTSDDAREIVGTLFNATAAAGVYCSDPDEYATGPGGTGTNVACFSFPAVAMTTCSQALLKLLTSLSFTEYPGTFRVRGEKPSAAAVNLRWTTGNRPSSKYISPAGNVATTAYADGGSDATTTPTVLTIDVTSIVQEIFAAPYWASGDKVNLYVVAQTGNYTQFNFGQVQAGDTPARLEITG